MCGALGKKSLSFYSDSVIAMQKGQRSNIPFFRPVSQSTQPDYEFDSLPVTKTYFGFDTLIILFHNLRRLNMFNEFKLKVIYEQFGMCYLIYYFTT